MSLQSGTTLWGTSNPSPPSAPSGHRHTGIWSLLGSEVGRLWNARFVGNNDHLAFYAEPGRHTTLSVDDAVSGGIREMVAAVQGLLIYDVVAAPFYGVELSAAQADAIHERDSARLLAAARTVDDRH